MSPDAILLLADRADKDPLDPNQVGTLANFQTQIGDEAAVGYTVGLYVVKSIRTNAPVS